MLLLRCLWIKSPLYLLSGTMKLASWDTGFSQRTPFICTDCKRGNQAHWTSWEGREGTNSKQEIRASLLSMVQPAVSNALSDSHPGATTTSSERPRWWSECAHVCLSECVRCSKDPLRDFPSGPMVRTLCFHWRGSQVQSLVWKLRSCMLCCQKKKKKPLSFYRGILRYRETWAVII